MALRARSVGSIPRRTNRNGRPDWIPTRRIPKAFAEEVGAYPGADVDLSIEGGQLVVRVARSPSLSLEKLLAGVTPENVHHEIDTGAPVGREVW